MFMCHLTLGCVSFGVHFRICNRSDLLGVVSDSGLVDAMSVSNALIQLALRVEREGVVVSKCRALAVVPVLSPSRAKSPLQSASGQAIIEQEDDHSGVDATEKRSSEASYDTSPTMNNSKRSVSKHRTINRKERARSLSRSKSPFKLAPKEVMTEQVVAAKTSPLKTARTKAIIEQEEDVNSIVEEEAPDDWSDMSHDTPPTTVNSKKRSINPKTSSPSPPPTVTPQRAMQKPRVTGTPPHMVRGEKLQQERSSSPRAGTTIRESLGHFLAERVDTLCIRPYNESTDACFTDDVPYNESKDACYSVNVTNAATKSHG